MLNQRKICTTTDTLQIYQIKYAQTYPSFPPLILPQFPYPRFILNGIRETITRRTCRTVVFSSTSAFRTRCFTLQRSLIGLQFQKSGHCSDCLNLLTSTVRLSLLDFILSGAIYHKTVNKSTQMCTQSNWESNTDFLCTLVFTNIFLFPCIKC